MGCSGTSTLTLPCTVHSGWILQPLLFLLPNTTVQLLLLNLCLLCYEGGDSSTHTLHEQHCRAAVAPNCDISSIPLPSPQAPLEHRRDAQEHGLGHAWRGGQSVHHPLVSRNLRLMKKHLSAMVFARLI